MKIKYYIFGGSGFIGQHLRNNLKFNYLNMDLASTEKYYKYCDVRNPINIDTENRIEIIYNLAAIHMTPGHKYDEYFETNIMGAENICNFARENNVNTIVFTSSIAPYGAWEDEKIEISLPLPTSAYGSSKLVAEEIHKRWQYEKPDERKLIILRPGIVFGNNERGNFSRLYRLMKSGRFFYPGRKDTKKAAIYVKDLVRIMIEMTTKESPGVHIFNTVYTPCHTIEEICKTLAHVTIIKEPRIMIPSSILIMIAKSINSFGRIIGRSYNGIHPDRVKKLIISTNINGQKLLEYGYRLNYSLAEAIEDWYNDCNREGLY